jgi:hypothetical protein
MTFDDGDDLGLPKEPLDCVETLPVPATGQRLR